METPATRGDFTSALGEGTRACVECCEARLGPAEPLKELQPLRFSLSGRCTSESRAFCDVDGLKYCGAVRDAHFHEWSCVAQFNRAWSNDSADGKHLHRLPLLLHTHSICTPDFKGHGPHPSLVGQITSTRLSRNSHRRFAGDGIGYIGRPSWILPPDRMREGQVGTCIPRRMRRPSHGSPA